MKGVNKWSRRLGWLVLAGAILGSGGCMLAVAGAAGAGAAAGYLYYNGLLYRTYHASMGDTLSAVRTALLELQFPIIKEKLDSGSAFIQTRSGYGHTVRIYLDLTPSPIPAEGAVTRVGIRVGFSGDEGVSARILDQVSRHLVPAGAALGNPRPVPETPPPPLAGGTAGR